MTGEWILTPVPSHPYKDTPVPSLSHDRIKKKIPVLSQCQKNDSRPVPSRHVLCFFFLQSTVHTRHALVRWLQPTSHQSRQERIKNRHSAHFFTLCKSTHRDLTPAGAYNPSHRTIHRQSLTQTAQINSCLQ